MSELNDSLKKAFNNAEKAALKAEKDILKIYTSSLKSIRADMLKMNEKVTWSLAELQKYDRLTNLNKQIIAEVAKINAAAYNEIKRTNIAVVNNTYNRNWFGLEKD